MIRMIGLFQSSPWFCGIMWQGFQTRRWNEGKHYSCCALLGLLDTLYSISSGITAGVLIALFVFSDGIVIYASIVLQRIEVYLLYNGKLLFLLKKVYSLIKHLHQPDFLNDFFFFSKGNITSWVFILILSMGLQ